MGKNLETFKGRIAGIETAAEKQGDNKYAYLTGTYKTLAEHYAQLCDLKDITINADQAPQAVRRGMVQVVIKLDDVKLTVEGTYRAEEAESEDSPGFNAKFEVDGVYAGRTEVTCLLADRIYDIEDLALEAHQKAIEEAAAADLFDARRAA